MNINPKKSWHVRSKQNLAKVRKDEAKAAEEEKEKQRRIDLAESEARSDLLRKFASSKAVVKETVETSVQEKKLTHVNFFEDLEAGDKVLKRNKENEEEKKREKEKLEKEVGLLTYLGQGSSEFEGTKPWYVDKKIKDSKNEVELKTKRFLDPLSNMQSYLRLTHKYQKRKKGEDVKKKEKFKSHKDTHKKSSKVVKTVREMREDRIARERKERLRSERLLKGEKCEEKEVVLDVRKMSYNTRFNPEMARFKK